MINPYHLRYFVDAAQMGSVSKAAQKNRVSQSAVSQAIRSLERSLGLQLTTHHKKTFHLTDEGKAILQHSGEVFRSLNLLSDAVQSIEKGYSGALSIACTGTVALGLLPPILAQLCQDYPKLQPKIRVGNSETIKDWLHQKEADVGIMVDDGRLTRDFQKVIIHSGRYVLFRNTHSKKRQTKVPALVVTRRERAEVQYFLKHLSQTPRSVEIRFEMTSWEAIKAYITLSDDWGICPDYVIEKEVRQRMLTPVPISFPSPKYNLIALYRSREPLGRNAHLLVKTLATLRETFFSNPSGCLSRQANPELRA